MQDSLLNQFDNTELLQLDPHYVNGYKLYAIHNARLEVRMSESNDSEEKQQILFKFYIRLKQKSIQSILIDILSESDLFFGFQIEMSETDFLRIKDQQELEVSFSEFLDLLLELLEQSETNQKITYLKITNIKRAELKVVQKTISKQYDMLTLEATRPEEQDLRRMVAYRYGFVRTEINKMEGRIMDVRHLIKMKNPYLLNYLNKL